MERQEVGEQHSGALGPPHPSLPVAVGVSVVTALSLLFPHPQRAVREGRLYSCPRGLLTVTLAGTGHSQGDGGKPPWEEGLRREWGGKCVMSEQLLVCSGPRRPLCRKGTMWKVWRE